MYAVIQTGGKQYRVAEGDVITVNRLKGNPGDSIEFATVVLLENNGQLRVKKSEVKSVKVTGKILGAIQGKKIRVFRYRRRKNTMRTKGSRPKFTTVSIQKILTV
jgi:large subunit ribosomal protein L21